MSARIGIELAPSVCRIVELDAPLDRTRHGVTTPRVRSFSVLPSSDPALLDVFRAFRRRHASVIVWGAADHHRQVVVADGSYERMRAEGLAAVREAGVPIKTAASDIAPAPVAARGARRRPVLLATADGAALDAALAPLVGAGIRIDTVLTPAAALLSVARMRRLVDGTEPSTEDEAFVALEESVGCATLIRGTTMLAARTLPWGYVDERGGRRLLRPRQEIATRLAGDLAEFVSAARRDPGSLAQISVCGGVPDLRSMSAQLVERLDVEVEPLDMLFGIDPAGLPASTEPFGDRVAELRLAWAAAADARPAIDLFRARRYRAARKYGSRAAIAAGIVAGLGVGWLVQDRWAPALPRSAAPRRNVVEQVRPSQPAFTADRPAPPPVASLPTGLTAQAPAVLPASNASEPAVPPPAPLPIRTASVPDVVPASTGGQPAPTGPEPVRSVETTAPPPAAASQGLRSAGPSATRPRPVDVPLPFEASLSTILFGPERRLAIVDGRIVGEGDEIKGAQIVEITPTSVLLRDAQGRLRRLTGGK
jgi:hypothetical protein